MAAQVIGSGPAAPPPAPSCPYSLNDNGMHVLPSGRVGTVALDDECQLRLDGREQRSVAGSHRGDERHRVGDHHLACSPQSVQCAARGEPDDWRPVVRGFAERRVAPRRRLQFRRRQRHPLAERVGRSAVGVADERCQPARRRLGCRRSRSPTRDGESLERLTSTPTDARTCCGSTIKAMSPSGSWTANVRLPGICSP